VFCPCTAGEVLKKKCIVAPPLTIIKVSAGIPFTVKSLASTFAGPGGLKLTVKSVGGLKTVVPQFGLVTVQPGVGVTLGDAVGVAVGVAVAVGVNAAVAVAVAVAVALGVAVEVAVAVAVAVAVGVNAALAVAVGVGVGVPPVGMRNAYTLLSFAT